jgi:hypothetical protein
MGRIHVMQSGRERTFNHPAIIGRSINRFKYPDYSQLQTGVDSSLDMNYGALWR